MEMPTTSSGSSVVSSWASLEASVCVIESLRGFFVGKGDEQPELAMARQDEELRKGHRLEECSVASGSYLFVVC